MINHSFSIRAKVWIYSGMAGWHFVTIPKKEGTILNEQFGKKLKRGWGSIPVTISCGRTTWNTSIFPDKKSGSYLLPLKAQVRKKENINVDDTILFHLKVNI